jgi:hypothetical protein
LKLISTLVALPNISLTRWHLKRLSIELKYTKTFHLALTINCMCTSPVFSRAVSIYRKGVIFSHVFLDFFCGSKIRDLCLSYVKTNEQKKKKHQQFLMMTCYYSDFKNMLWSVSCYKGGYKDNVRVFQSCFLKNQTWCLWLFVRQA